MNTLRKEKQTAKPPETLFQLLVLIVKSLFKSIPRTLIRLGIIVMFTYVVHTYLVIYPNGGFFHKGTSLSKILELKKSGGSGVIIWSVISATLFSTYSLMRSRGISTFFNGIVKTPARLVNALDKKKSFIMFLLVELSFLLGYYWIKNDMMTLVFAIAFVLSAAAFHSSFTYVVMRLGHSDFHRLFGNKDKKFNEEIHLIVLIAFGIGFLLYTVLPKSFFSVIIMTSLLIAVGVLLYAKRKNGRKAAMLFFGIQLFGLCSYIVYGDTEGSVSDAGSFINWLRSDSLLIVTELGVPLALGAGIFGLIGWGLGESGITNIFTDSAAPENMTETTQETKEEGSELPEDMTDAEIIGESNEETVKEGSELPEDMTDAKIIGESNEETVKEGSEMPEDMTDAEITGETISESIEDISAIGESGAGSVDETATIVEETIEDTVDDVGEMYNTPVDMHDNGLESVAEGLQVIEEAWGMSVDDLGELYEALCDPAIRNEALATSYDDLNNQVIDIYENPNILWETFVESTDNINGIITELQDGIMTSDTMDTIFGALDSYLPDWIIKDDKIANDAWDFLGNITDVDGELDLIPEGSILDRIGTPAGMTKDLLGHIGDGDNFIYGGIKSIISNVAKGNVMEGNVSVKMMEMFSNILLGASNADSIVNSGITIHGTVNYIMNRVRETVNGSYDTGSRLDGVEYGGFYQTMDQAFEEAVDAVYDTTDFVQRLKDSYTIDGFFEDMRTKNHNLWQVKDSSLTTRTFDQLAQQPGSIFQIVNNRNACYLGEKIFDGLTYMGQGATHAGSHTIQAIDNMTDSTIHWIKSMW